MKSVKLDPFFEEILKAALKSKVTSKVTRKRYKLSEDFQKN